MDLQFFATLLKIIVVLPFVLMLIYISIKYGGGKLQDLQKVKYMKVLDRLSLSKENNILVVKIGEKAYVVSSVQGKIEILFEVPSEDIIKIECSKEIPEYRNIKDLINKLKSKKEDKDEETKY
ncbi:flagellar biosynthetic protein FliO [Clostridium sp. HMP27]|uniref:flagellar biosynthetic protein FliO n=1 Tax=Clostridium sp. HMP27 TaxID=1487921 RepID=UPI00052C2098|nr:flagellar biosynthetic protein FliO [Clostridium sp. HMP27]KGK86109.1 flagellar biosynthesis protein FliZ [Clostridium sp. HMP27]